MIPVGVPAPSLTTKVLEQTPQKRQLITQADVLDAYQQRVRFIVLRPDAIITPLARQVAKEKGVELR